MFLNLLYFIASILVLVYSGSFVVRALTSLAQSLKISYFLIGFAMMAFATAVSETILGISSALAKTPQLALGTVIGSNLVNLTFIIGLVAVAGKGLKIEQKFLQQDINYMILVAALPFLLFLDGDLDRIDAAILLVSFFIYLSILISQRKKFHGVLTQGPLLGDVFKNVLIFIAAAAALILSARLAVWSGEQLALGWGVPLAIVGLLALAWGTSLPELVVSLRAMRAGQKLLAVGDLIGEVAVNSTFALSVTALISPIQNLKLSEFALSSIFLLFVFLIFALWVRYHQGVSVRLGYFLISLYVLFFALEILRIF